MPSETIIPTLTTKPTKFYSLDTDYSPIIIAVAAGFGGFIVFVCCMCAVHSWWLKRKKFTDVNSTPLSKIEKKRRKQELLEARMREALGKDFKLLQDGKGQDETSNFTSDDPNANERG